MLNTSTKFLVKGGQPLHGTITISGAKNAASKEIIASMLTNETVYLSNCPISISEIEITRQICEALGSKFKKFENNEAVIETKNIHASSFSASLGIINRIGILTVGPLLIRIGEAKIPKLGGDKIGARPIDFHLNGLIQMGASVKEYKNFYYLKCKQLKGANIALPFPSVGATENIILAAVLAEGITFIHNAAIEPEIIDLIKMLQKMGAIIDVMTDRTIVITGVRKLFGTKHRVIPDRLEAASFACAAIASKGDVIILDARQEDMITFLNSIRLIGADYEILDNGIMFYYKDKLKPINIETDVHPGFMTDWQPPFTILLTQTTGTSVIKESVYENRFGYVTELNKMGADIKLFDNFFGNRPGRFKNSDEVQTAIINGPTKLFAADIVVPDIRAGFSYLIAAIIAKGDSVINGAHYIDRGYENIDKKLNKLGAKISRIN